VDEVREEHFAIVNQVWQVDEEGVPNYVNLVYVSDNPSKTDQYGRQIEHATSVLRFDPDINAAGRYFRIEPALLP
jgi:hypothetical protein